MKKRVYFVLSIMILSVILIYMKVYYPSLPVNSVSRREVINKINNSSDGIVKIAEENSYQWYISEMDHGKAYENLKKLMEDKGWYFKDQVGSGFVFESEQGEIMVLSEMWTKNYVIFHFPKEI